ncbi:MAG: o-succinylbenzoate synthase [Actinomycetes bacterium]
MTLSSDLRGVFQDAAVVALPTRTDFRGISVREAFLFRGTHGWSEFSPFVEYGSKESKVWLQAAIEGAYQPWPQFFRTDIAINATLPRISPNEVPDFLSRFPGCTTVKMKVNDFISDADRLEAVLDQIPDAKIRLDVNGGWSLHEALLYLHDYNLRFGKVFEYVEQPCESLSDLAKLRAEIPFPIAVDESIRKNLSGDLQELSAIADVAVIKWAPSGGISAAHKLISEINLPVVVSSALETSIGISHNLALAASLPELTFACGLGTLALLNGDIAEDPLIVDSGRISVRRVHVNAELLEKYRAAPEREAWWHNRMESLWDEEFALHIDKLGWLK